MTAKPYDRAVFIKIITVIKYLWTNFIKNLYKFVSQWYNKDETKETKRRRAVFVRFVERHPSVFFC